MRISSRIEQVRESTTLAIAARAAELRAAGRNIISLAAGEPDFATPSAASEAGIQAIRNGETHYTPVAGIAPLRKAVSEAIARDYDLNYDPSQICISAGTKPAIWLALTALLEPGDLVVVVAPYWVSYPDIVALAGGEVLLLETDEQNGFVPTQEQLETALGSPGVRGILINSPSNPTGAIWPPERIEQLVAICARRDRWIVSDEIYSELHFDDTRVVSPTQIPGGRERTVLLNGFSKTYAMTGWRMGWLAAPPELVRGVIRAQSQLMGNACSISQAAALEALAPRNRGDVDKMIDAFRKRRAFLIPAVQRIEGFSLHPPSGAFYAFPGVQPLIAARGLADDVALAKTLLEQTEVATVPGTAFGRPGHIRLSFAASLEDLHEAMERIWRWAGSPT